MRIAILGTRGIPAQYGGFETCVEETATRLAADGHEVTVYCRRGNVGPAGESYRGVRLVRLPSIPRKSLDTVSHTFLSLLHLLTHGGADVAHLYGLGNALYLLPLRCAGIPAALSVDGLEWNRRKWGTFARLWFRASELLAIRWSAAIVADSRVIETYYRERLRREATYVPYGAYVAEDPGSEALGRYGLEKRRYILFVGRLIPEKGVHYLLEAYREVETEMPLVIVGDDPYNRDYVRSLRAQADPRARFLGYVYGPPCQQLRYHAHLYVQPSELEGTSPALLEAMGSGNCVIVNGIPENRETVGDAGVVYERNDVEDLRAALERLLKDPDLAREYGQRARERVRRHYSWDRVTADLTHLYTSLSKAARVGKRGEGR